MAKFGSKGMSCSEFVDLMKERGFTYNEKDGGFLNVRKKTAGKLTRNGYRTLTLQKNNKNYTFCEHRCVWAWFNGEIPNGKVINHKDFDRSNNKIENLEVVTYKENLKYTKDAGRCNPPYGEKSSKAIWSDKEAQAMKWLHKNGWPIKDIAKFFGSKYDNVVGRIIKGSRYGHVPDAVDVVSVYPAIVMQTMNHKLSKKEQILNATIGLCGELGEAADLIKKSYFQGHDLDVDHLKEEVGDIIYYLTLLMILYGMDLSDTMFGNWDKLNKRYPEGFEAERSIHRAEGDI